MAQASNISKNKPSNLFGWRGDVKRIEDEARTARGNHRDPKNRLEAVAQELLDAITSLGKLRAAGNIDGALNSMMSLCKSYEDFWLLRDVPEYRRSTVSTQMVLRDLRRGAKKNRLTRPSTIERIQAELDKYRQSGKRPSPKHIADNLGLKSVEYVRRKIRILPKLS